MNEQAANALYEAERKGVKQIKGQLFDERGGRCAVGVLRDLDLDHFARQPGSRCPLCGTAERGDLETDGTPTEAVILDEGDVIVHLNDCHGLTFSEIARKLGPDSA